METFDKKEISIKMAKTITSYKKDIGTLRTGRANPSMLDLIRVDVYGQKMPINQLATVTIPEPRTISIQVWDKNNVNLVDTEIKKSNLGINPQVDGQILRIRIPQLTEERRVELTKVLKKEGEQAKIALRNIRRNINTNITNLEKDKKISKDFERDYMIEIQDITDKYIKQSEEIINNKINEISEV